MIHLSLLNHKSHSQGHRIANDIVEAAVVMVKYGIAMVEWH
jgi:hypothetical protein